MTSWITFILASTLTVAAERAPEPGRGQRLHKGADISKYIDRVAEVVNADEEQTAKLEAIKAEHKEAIEAARAQADELTEEQQAELDELRQQMRKARRAGNDAEFKELRSQVRTIVGHEPGAIMESTNEKIAAVLTPEQLTAFQEMAKQGKGRRGREDGRHRGRGRPQGERFGRGMRIDRFVERVADAVEATDEQRETFETIKAEHHEMAKQARVQAAAAREANRDELKELRDQLRDAREDGDTEAVEMIHGEIKKLMGGDAKQLMDATIAKIRNVLTEEQLPAFEATLQDAQAKMKQRRPGMRHGKEGKRRGRGGQHSQRQSTQE